jgi:hypothetical protein
MTVKHYARYLKDGMDPKMIDRRVRDFRADIRNGVIPPGTDTLVGRGLSGCIMVPILARTARMNFALVRKDRQDCHSDNMLEGTLGSKWLFIDDLISSGETFRETARVVVAVAEDEDHDIDFAGGWFYDKWKVGYRDLTYFDRRIREWKLWDAVTVRTSRRGRPAGLLEAVSASEPSLLMA